MLVVQMFWRDAEERKSHSGGLRRSRFDWVGRTEKKRAATPVSCECIDMATICRKNETHAPPQANTTYGMAGRLSITCAAGVVSDNSCSLFHDGIGFAGNVITHRALVGIPPIESSALRVPGFSAVIVGKPSQPRRTLLFSTAPCHSGRTL